MKARKSKIRKQRPEQRPEDATRLSLAETAGQSGDLQGLTDVAGSSSESVAELVAEGQSFEAGIVEGIENAPPAGESEVKTRELSEDDVPLEYTQRDAEGRPET
jgi:N-acetylmuramic acid 6-phosphate (MurNAc-6-P) etherase